MLYLSCLGKTINKNNYKTDKLSTTGERPLNNGYFWNNFTYEYKILLGKYFL